VTEGFFFAQQTHRGASEKSRRHKPLQCRRGAAPGTTRAGNGPGGGLAKNQSEALSRSRFAVVVLRPYFERRHPHAGEVVSEVRMLDGALRE
jgi:hypothetical protein